MLPDFDGTPGYSGARQACCIVARSYAARKIWGGVHLVYVVDVEMSTGHRGECVAHEVHGVHAFGNAAVRTRAGHETATVADDLQGDSDGTKRDQRGTYEGYINTIADARQPRTRTLSPKRVILFR